MMIGSTTSNIIFEYSFNDTATTEIYTLSLHDALPICWHQTNGGFHHEIRSTSSASPIQSVSILKSSSVAVKGSYPQAALRPHPAQNRCRRPLSLDRRADSRSFRDQDRKSTRLNSSHAN